MTGNGFDAFSQIWLVDFEFRQPDGERPQPLCILASELRSMRLVRTWLADEPRLIRPPFPTDERSLFVAYYASAELGCFSSLGWKPPSRILDLYVEFARLVSGRLPPCGKGLLGAMAYFGLDSIAAVEKEKLRSLAMRGGPYTAAEKDALLDYCQSDVDALAQLLPAMAPGIDLPRALFRGRYMVSVAAMEAAGTPIDRVLLSRLRRYWPDIRNSLVDRVNEEFEVYVPTGVSQAVIVEAAASEVDALALDETAKHLADLEMGGRRDTFEAVKEARRQTGMTRNAMTRWIEAGRDPVSWPELDVKARSLAGEFPALGIGVGYRQEDGFDDTDYAQNLWDLLSRPDPRPRRSHELLREAASFIHENGIDRIRPRSWTFSSRRFADWLIANGIPWPRLASGALALDDETFRQMARQYPQVSLLRELRHSLAELRQLSLTVGADGRNRCLLSPFASKTGRNQPSNAKFVFGPSVWLRRLIRPEKGRALAYLDWSSQEFAIAAALSGDEAMKAAYRSGDPYLWFAKQAGAVPSNATKSSHAEIREQFKICCLAVQYGMQADSLATAIGKSRAHASDLLRLHREAFPRFWEWSVAAVDAAMLTGYLDSVFGWRVHVGPDANPRSLANFPMQANGAEMLRLACSLMTEAGIEVHAPVHDAVLIGGPIGEIESIVARARQLMEQAGRVVLNGFVVRTDAKVVRYPDAYSDPRGDRFFQLVNELVDEAEQRDGEAARTWDIGDPNQSGDVDDGWGFGDPPLGCERPKDGSPEGHPSPLISCNPSLSMEEW